MAALEESIAAVKGKGDGKAPQAGGEETQSRQSRAETHRLARQVEILEVARGRQTARSRSTGVS